LGGEWQESSDLAWIMILRLLPIAITPDAIPRLLSITPRVSAKDEDSFAISPSSSYPLGSP
jgi:hypothetical protein